MGEVAGRVGTLVMVAGLLTVSACGSPGPSARVTITNDTGQPIRVTGSCVADDPHSLAPGATDNMLFLGADCLVDNGDGLNGVLGCVTLIERRTDLTLAALRPITSPDDCRGGGTP